MTIEEYVSKGATVNKDITVTRSKLCGLGLQIASTSNSTDETVLISIPQNLFLYASKIKEMANNDSVLMSWLNLDHCTKTDTLHRGLLYFWLFGKSEFTEYLKSLPTDINLPFSYSNKKMESLDFSTVSFNYAVISKRLEIERLYERFIASHVEHANSVTLEQWILPYQWISSRGLKHPVLDEVCMVPLIDLCNHSTHNSNVRYDIDEKGNFELRLLPTEGSDKPIDLLLNYGNRSSAEFLFNYGFVPNDRSPADFDEIVKFFNPKSNEVRNILDPGRATKDASEEERFKLSLAYEVLLEFFSDHFPQKLRIVVLPEELETDPAKRYRFHNHFIMALASDEHLELVTEDHKRVLYLGKSELHPETVFDSVQKLGDNTIIPKARRLVAQLCDAFYKDLLRVDQDSAIGELAKVEAEIYKGFSSSVI